MSLTEIPTKRPAELVGIAGGLATLAASLGLNLTGAQTAGLAATAGVLPAVVSYLKDHHGIKGVFGGIWRGGNGGGE